MRTGFFTRLIARLRGVRTPQQGTGTDTYRETHDEQRRAPGRHHDPQAAYGNLLGSPDGRSSERGRYR